MVFFGWGKGMRGLVIRWKFSTSVTQGMLLCYCMTICRVISLRTHAPLQCVQGCLPVDFFMNSRNDRIGSFWCICVVLFFSFNINAYDSINYWNPIGHGYLKNYIVLKVLYFEWYVWKFLSFEKFQLISITLIYFLWYVQR